MRFLWPNKLDPEPTAAVRFGRVLHWIATAMAVLIAAGATFAFGLAVYQAATFAGYWSRYSDTYYAYWPNSAGAGAALLVFGLLVYFAGRALRYIFSGE